MKRLLKSIARGCWRASAPIRRPVARKLAASFRGSVTAAIREEVQPRLDQAILGVGHARTEVGTYRNETNLVLDSLVRELSRLQDQVESLQLLVLQAAGTGEALGVVGEGDAETSEAA